MEWVEVQIEDPDETFYESAKEKPKSLSVHVKVSGNKDVTAIQDQLVLDAPYIGFKQSGVKFCDDDKRSVKVWRLIRTLLLRPNLRAIGGPKGRGTFPQQIVDEMTSRAAPKYPNRRGFYHNDGAGNWAIIIPNGSEEFNKWIDSIPEDALSTFEQEPVEYSTVINVTHTAKLENLDDFSKEAKEAITETVLLNIPYASTPKDIEAKHVRITAIYEIPVSALKQDSTAPQAKFASHARRRQRYPKRGETSGDIRRKLEALAGRRDDVAAARDAFDNLSLGNYASDPDDR